MRGAARYVVSLILSRRPRWLVWARSCSLTQNDQMSQRERPTPALQMRRLARDLARLKSLPREQWDERLTEIGCRFAAGYVYQPRDMIARHGKNA